MMNCFVVCVAAFGANSSFAGTWQVTQNGADLQSVNAGEWPTNYYMDASADGTKLLAGLTSDSTFSTVSAAPCISYRVTWTPSYVGETPPTQAYGTFQMAGNLFGPEGSSGSIISSSNASLLNSLGSDGTYVTLYSLVVCAPLTTLQDGSAVGSFDIPLDTLTCSGGATVRERATYLSVSDSLVLKQEQKSRIVRTSNFKNQKLTIFAKKTL